MQSGCGGEGVKSESCLGRFGHFWTKLRAETADIEIKNRAGRIVVVYPLMILSDDTINIEIRGLS